MFNSSCLKLNLVLNCFFPYRLQSINDERTLLSKDCSVVLEDIAGVANAVFQTYNPVVDKVTNDRSVQDIVKEVSNVLKTFIFKIILIEYKKNAL